MLPKVPPKASTINIKHINKILYPIFMIDYQDIFKRLKKASKDWKVPIVTELGEFQNDPYLVLVSCIISLRTKDEVTAVSSRKLFKIADTPEKMAKLSEEAIAQAIYPAGFYRNKARQIKQISQELIGKYNGKVPTDIDKLMTFKGVGRKTATIVMVYGHKIDDFIPVDIHCHRMPNRLGWIKTKTPEETEVALERLIPKQYWHDFNDLFVRFGQNVCLPVSPWCSKCPIEKYCKRIGVERSR